jgi:DNA-binding GntR family transcriptional regulator
MARRAAIVRRSLAEVLADRLRDKIISGALGGGFKIDEPVLCSQFGVSRTPLREAVKILANEGLVVLTPNRGARVATITSDEIAELFPVMGVLEGLAGELAVRRLDQKGLARIEGLHVGMIACRDSDDWLGYSKANRAIHELIFTIAGNSALLQTYQQLMVRIHSVRFVVKQSATAWDQAVADHEAMLMALRSLDGPKLGRILRRHLDNKARSVIAALDKAG